MLAGGCDSQDPAWNCCWTNSCSGFPSAEQKQRTPKAGESWRVLEHLVLKKRKKRCLLEKKLLKFANGNLACAFLQMFSTTVCAKVGCLT